MMSCRLLFSAAIWSHAGASNSTVDNTEFKVMLPGAAKCSDGTQAAFYGSPSPTGSKKWIIEIEGGGLCESYADCQDRAKGDLGSSKALKDTIQMSGMHDRDPKINPDFHDWNHVFVPYCTGDVWIGKMNASANPWQSTGDKFFFSGHIILETLVSELKKSYALGSAEEVLFGGCSAGGIGTFHNADWLAGELPGAKVKANPQAGWFGLPINAYKYWSDGKPDPDPKHGGESDWLDKVVTYGSSPGEGAVYECSKDTGKPVGVTGCGSVPEFYPYTKTPMFVSENSADSYQVFVQGQCPSDGSDKAWSYIYYLQKILSGSLTTTVINGGKKKKDGLFAPDCLAHCLPWSGPTIGGVTQQEALGNWYFGRGGETMLIDNAADKTKLSSCTD